VRILIVTPILPYPADSGTRIRLAHVVDTLRRRHEPSLLSLESGDAEHAAKALGIPVEIHPVHAQRGWSAVNVTASTTATIWETARRTRATAVHLQGTFAAAAAGLHRARPAMPTVIDDGCVYHLSYARAARLAPTTLERARGRLRTWRVRRQETRLARAADALVAVSEDEARRMRLLAPATTVIVAPNGVDVDAVAPTPPGDAVLFVGLLSYAPNRDAMEWFAREVLPHLAADDPEVLVAGRDPGPGLQALAREQPRLRLLGFVPDLAPLYARAAVFINPMRGGGGTRLKMLGAMAAGKAVVSTTIGAEGLALTHGRDVVLADTPRAFAAEIRELLRNRTRAERMGRAARALVETRYRWEACLAPLDDLYASLARPGTER
jgi:glycosyltransferase involved in cell wall biosynthesis